MGEKKNPLVLSRIYTRTGDDGTTALGDMSRASKNDPRLVAYADTDEANASIGVAIALGDLDQDMRNVLARIQNELFDAGADLARPVTDAPALRITEDYIQRLEADCDEWNAPLETLRSFVLSGGTKGAALLHMSRTIVRRAERSAWAAVASDPETTSGMPAKYLNRLSDLLFILARRATGEEGDVLWVPGGQRLPLARPAPPRARLPACLPAPRPSSRARFVGDASSDALWRVRLVSHRPEWGPVGVTPTGQGGPGDPQCANIQLQKVITW
jgi:cob(I)alamin adenosyltransferase